MDPLVASYEGQKVCCTCKHFRQHYLLFRGEYYPAWCGHCTLVRAKHRNPGQKGCENWTPGQEQPPVE